MKARVVSDPAKPKSLLLVVIATMTLGLQLEAGEPKAETLGAWYGYVRLTERRVDQKLASETGFFADEAPP